MFKKGDPAVFSIRNAPSSFGKRCIDCMVVATNNKTPHLLPFNTSHPEARDSLDNTTNRRYLTWPLRPERRDIDPIIAGLALQRWHPPVAPETVPTLLRRQRPWCCHQPELILGPALETRTSCWVVDGGEAEGNQVIKFGVGEEQKGVTGVISAAARAHSMFSTPPTLETKWTWGEMERRRGIKHPTNNSNTPRV